MFKSSWAIVLCLFFSGAVYSRNDCTAPADNIFFAYNQDCLASLGNEKVLFMADTLHRATGNEETLQKTEMRGGASARSSGMHDMHRLAAENKEWKLFSKMKQSQNFRLMALFLFMLFLVVASFLYRQRGLRIRLKRSDDELDKKKLTLHITENELREAKQVAGRNSLLKTRFAQNMSHEIRTPLNAIVGFSAVLADRFGKSKNETAQFALLIEENSQHLLRLIGDILDLSVLEDNPETFDIGLVDVNKCCVICAKGVTPALKTGVILSFEPERKNFFINSNKERLMQVLHNLLDNAVKFTYKGRITLTYEVKEIEVIFTLTDTGIGIPPDKRASVFNRFVKLDEFTKGTGLGLFTSLIIVEKLGGNLKIDEEYTGGTRIILLLPLR